MDAFTLDDATAAILSKLTGEKLEHIGMMYQDGEAVKHTAPQATGQSTTVRATVRIPKGSLRALFHNHPLATGDRRDMREQGGGEGFSDDDKAQARKLGVPSYIITPTGRVMKFDPIANKIVEVLAQLPVRTSGAHNTLVE